MDVSGLAAALAAETATRGVELLVLHGSRARGDAGESSDWDVGYLGAAVEPVALVDDAFRMLAEAGVLDAELADRLARAAAFRNLIVHADARLDLTRVHAIAAMAGVDLRAFLAALRDRTGRGAAIATG